MIKAVAEVKNLTRASDILYLSQSALSHQLKEVENFFETQVFIRNNKQMILTEPGKMILSAGENILKELELVKKEIKSLKDENAGEIRVSTECYTSYHWLSKFMRDFKVHHPQVVVRINADATYKTEQALLANEIDIAIVEDNANSRLSYSPLFHDEFYALVSDEHAWANRKTVRQEEFQ